MAERENLLSRWAEIQREYSNNPENDKLATELTIAEEQLTKINAVLGINETTNKEDLKRHLRGQQNQNPVTEFPERTVTTAQPAEKIVPTPPYPEEDDIPLLENPIILETPAEQNPQEGIDPDIAKKQERVEARVQEVSKRQAELENAPKQWGQTATTDRQRELSELNKEAGSLSTAQRILERERAKTPVAAFAIETEITPEEEEAFLRMEANQEARRGEETIPSTFEIAIAGLEERAKKQAARTKTPRQEETVPEVKPEAERIAQMVAAARQIVQELGDRIERPGNNGGSSSPEQVLTPTQNELRTMEEELRARGIKEGMLDRLRAMGRWLRTKRETAFMLSFDLLAGASSALSATNSLPRKTALALCITALVGLQTKDSIDKIDATPKSEIATIIAPAPTPAARSPFDQKNGGEWTVVHGARLPGNTPKNIAVPKSKPPAHGQTDVKIIPPKAAAWSAAILPSSDNITPAWQGGLPYLDKEPKNEHVPTPADRQNNAIGNQILNPESPAKALDLQKSPEILASAAKNFRENIDMLLGSKGILRIGAQHGMDSLDWNDFTVGFAKKTANEILKISVFPNPETGSDRFFGAESREATVKMQGYLQELQKESRVAPLSGENVADYAKRALAEWFVQQQKSEQTTS
jgi:hypothetical protein